MQMDFVSNLLALTECAATLSLVEQLSSMGLAAIIGRFVKSRSSILMLSFLGAFGAMVAHILMDGQGAFMLLMFAPLIYFLATVGRLGLGR